MSLVDTVLVDFRYNIPKKLKKYYFYPMKVKVNFNLSEKNYESNESISNNGATLLYRKKL